MSTFAKVFKVILSIILSILGFIFITSFIALFVVRPAHIIDIVNMEIQALVEETEFSEFLTESFQEALPPEAEVSLEIVREFLQRENVSDQINSLAERYIRAFTEGDFDFYISSGDIADMVEVLAPDILEEFGVDLTQQYIDQIAEIIDDYVDLSELRIGRVIEETEVDLTAPRIVFSPYPLIIMGILSAWFIVNAFLIHRKRIAIAFIMVGMPLLLAGLTFVGGGFILNFLSGMIGELESQTIENIASSVVGLLLIPGSISLVIGLVSIAIFIGTIGKKTQKSVRIPEKIGGLFWIIIATAANAVLLYTCIYLAALVYRNYLA